MKENLWCKLFGHNFIGKRFSRESTDVIITFPMKWCMNCGLSKEELGIGVIKKC